MKRTIAMLTTAAVVALAPAANALPQRTYDETNPVSYTHLTLPTIYSV